MTPEQVVEIPRGGMSDEQLAYLGFGPDGEAPSTPPWLTELLRLKKHVEAALEYAGGTHELCDIAAGLDCGQFQMFTGPDSIVVTEFIEYPRKKALHIFLAGGHLDELERLLKPVEGFARRAGCSRVSLCGREGWGRSFMSKAGYKPNSRVMYKDLPEEAA